jgi:hypothetical protein
LLDGDGALIRPILAAHPALRLKFCAGHCLRGHGRHHRFFIFVGRLPCDLLAHSGIVSRLRQTHDLAARLRTVLFCLRCQSRYCGLDLCQARLDSCGIVRLAIDGFTTGARHKRDIEGLGAQLKDVTRQIDTLIALLTWRPHGDSNPGRIRERDGVLGL